MQRARLVGVQALDALPRKGAEDVGMQRRGQVDERRAAGPFVGFAHQPPILASGVQQRTPRLDLTVQGQDLVSCSARYPLAQT